VSQYRLHTPLSEEDVKALRAGDVVYLSGIIYSARDKAHALIRRSGCPVGLVGAAIYHCGPLIQKGRVLSAGPTTSGRLARYTEEMLQQGLRAIIGKGGLPAEPFRGRAVYLAYPGGCGAAAARQLEVVAVFLEHLGMAESFWAFQARDFGPLIVAIDSQGTDLYREARESTSTSTPGSTRA
jgi:fumarate hydratase subunit beta